MVPWGGILMHGSHVGHEFVRMRRIKKHTHYSFLPQFY